MDRPEIKPAKRMFDVWEKSVDGKHSRPRVMSVVFNSDETEESYHSNMQPGYFEYDAYVDIKFDNGKLVCIKADDFKTWFNFDPDLDGLWIWNLDVYKVCEQWAKFLRCEEKDRKTYERLKKKFE